MLCWDGSRHAGIRLRMTYDCVFGRYTLSVWPDDSITDPSRKRAVVDAAVVRLAEAVAAHLREPSVNPDGEADTAGRDAYPCGESVPPCTLVIPPAELMCPFIRSSESEYKSL